MPETDEEKRRRKERLTQSEKNERLIFSEGWYHDLAFCEGWFDRCEHAALVNSPRALGMAHTAVRMAETLNDPHLVHRAYGVLAHAHIGRVDFFWAGKTLEGYRRSAVECCPRCRADLLRRHGDLLGEERRSEESIVALDDCLEEGGHLFEDDERGRTLFLRSIPHYHRGNRDRALADAGGALRLISLDSPRGFFDDTMACLAIYVRGGGERDDAAALKHLEAFLERIRRLDEWQSTRIRHCWVEGLIHARMGNMRTAVRRMERAVARLLVDGEGREALAATIDYAQLKTRPKALRDDSLRTARRAIDRCLNLRADLPERQRKRLAKMEYLVRRHPEDAFRALGDFRRSFVAPVPSVLDERIGPE